MSGKVSHGRGGAANITYDDTEYTDGEIVREGPVGDQGDGKYSSGRGGTGNIGGESVPHGAPADDEIVPETATRVAKEESHHVGRGGAGNEHHVHSKAEKEKEKEEIINQYGFDKKIPKESLLDKAKKIMKKET